MSILNLPLVLQQEILGSWLTMKDVALMDSAVCSKEARLMFLELLTKETLMLSSSSIADAHISSWMAWVVKRGVNITACHLSKVVEPEVYTPFFAHSGKRLERLTIIRNDGDRMAFTQMLNCAGFYCTSIKEISLTRCSSVLGLENILWKSQKSITKLILDKCNLSGLQVGDWKLPSLLLLSISYCRSFVNSMLINLLQAAPNIEILNSCYLNIWKTESMVVFPKNLRIISLLNSEIENADFSSLVHNCPLLEAVQLTNCHHITDVSVLELVQHAKHLSALALSCNRNFTDAALEAVAVHCGERLRHLCLEGCYTITDAGLTHISEACHNLEGFALGCDPMDNHSIAAVQALLHNNPFLQEVSLAVEEDADVLLTTLATSCPQLRHLDISCLDGYTEVGIMAIMSGCFRLRTVVIASDCSVLNPLAQCLLKKHYCSKLEFICDDDENGGISGLLPFWLQYRFLESSYC